jgi:hypothetical protein
VRRNSSAGPYIGDAVRACTTVGVNGAITVLFWRKIYRKTQVNLLWASKITDVGCRKNIGMKNCQKATLPKISGKNPLFFLKINSSDCAPF